MARFHRLARWELGETWRNPFVAYSLAGSTLATYVLTYVYGLLRVEYFSRIAFVLVPLAFGILAGSRQTAQSEAQLRRLVATSPVTPGAAFGARLVGAAGVALAYGALVLPLTVWHAAAFPSRIPVLIAGLATSVMLAVSMAAISTVAAARLRRPAYAQTLIVGALFALASAVAIVPLGDSPAAIVTNLVPSVVAAQAADGFLDTKAPVALALVVLVSLTITILLGAFAAWTRPKGATKVALTAAVVLALASNVALVVSTDVVPYSNVTEASGSFRVRLNVDGFERTSGSHFASGETKTMRVWIDDPFGYAPAVPTRVSFSGDGLRVSPASALVEPGAGPKELTVRLRMEPTLSAIDEIRILRVTWDQEGTPKTSDFIMRGEIPGFRDAIPMMAAVTLVPLLVGSLRSRRGKRDASQESSSTAAEG